MTIKILKLILLIASLFLLVFSNVNIIYYLIYDEYYDIYRAILFSILSFVFLISICLLFYKEALNSKNLFNYFGELYFAIMAFQGIFTGMISGILPEFLLVFVLMYLFSPLLLILNPIVALDECFIYFALLANFEILFIFLVFYIKVKKSLDVNESRIKQIVKNSENKCE